MARFGNVRGRRTKWSQVTGRGRSKSDQSGAFAQLLRAEDEQAALLFKGIRPCLPSPSTYDHHLVPTYDGCELHCHDLGVNPLRDSRPGDVVVVRFDESFSFWFRLANPECPLCMTLDGHALFLSVSRDFCIPTEVDELVE